MMSRLGQTAPRTGSGIFSVFPRSPTLMSSDYGTWLVAFAEVSGGSASSGVFRFFRSSLGLTVLAPAIIGDPAPATGGGTYAPFSRPAAADAPPRAASSFCPSRERSRLVWPSPRC